MSQQIDSYTRQINLQPDDAYLYFERGKLFREHRELDAALQDFHRALRLNSTLPFVRFHIGRVMHETGDHAGALEYLDFFLTEQPNNAQGIKARARVLAALGQVDASVNDYDKLIVNLPSAGPEIYLERAQVLRDAGAAYFSEALKGLDLGIAKLGDLVVLQMAAIDILRSRKNFEDAQKRIGFILKNAIRKETWYALQGDTYAQAGQTENARQSYRLALGAIEQLPVPRQQVPAIKKLKVDIQRKLNADN